MTNQEYSAKFTIKDIEPKQDKNFNPYFLIHFENSNYKFGYAFKNSTENQTWITLTESSYKLVNRPVKIVYSLNQINQYSFCQVKSISLIE